MGDYYLPIRSVHICAVVLSGSIFALRGMLMLARSNHANHAALRYLSYTIDTLLLAAAIALTVISHRYPFVEAWLTVKVVLLFVYIGLGMVALTRGRTRTGRTIAYFAALAVYLFIVSVARAHNPWGAFGG